MRGSRTCVAAVGLALLTPVPAAAQDTGVVVDPDSPTAKQYSIPLESARRQADPKGGTLAPPGTQTGGDADAALFGEGITPAASSGEARSSGSKGAAERNGKREKAPRPSATAAPEASRSDDPVRAAISNPGAPSGGLGSTLLIAGGGALVLIIGGLAGFAVRRRSDA